MVDLITTEEETTILMDPYGGRLNEIIADQSDKLARYRDGLTLAQEHFEEQGMKDSTLGLAIAATLS